METYDEEFLPGLPNDIAIPCIARVSRSALGVMRCVNRSWRKLLSSPSFFEYRKNEGLSEPWLYVMLCDLSSQARWKAFDLAGKKWWTLPPLPKRTGSACAVLESKLYMIGGKSGSCCASKEVLVYDPCFNKWSEGAHMRVPREFPAMGAIGGKMYVMGGCLPRAWAGTSAWAEVFDPKQGDMGEWDVFPTPTELMRERWMHGSAVMDDKLFAVGDTGGLVLDPFAEDLSPVPDSLNECWRGKAAVVKEKLFSWNYLDKIIGYDLRTDSWRPLQVVGKQLPRLEWGINLVSVAGKLLVIGEHPGQGPLSVLEMTAVSIEDDGEDNSLRGKVVWSHTFTLDVKVLHILKCECIAL
ncbi:hypothetical protein Mapa_004494 [Marchantia paleacea]|nr:hypothetical protein Mapa_004494 [Marchantia paleacea]